VQIDPSAHEAWNYVGYTNRKLGNYADALAAYAKALSLKPGYPEALECRGEAYLGLNHIPDAKQAYLDLYAGDRKLADKLLNAMKAWVAAQRAAPGGASSGADDFDHWIQERAQISAQTAMLTRAAAGTTPAARGVLAADAAPYEWHLPRGFPTPQVPADNPMSDAKVALGRRLLNEHPVELGMKGREAVVTAGLAADPSYARDFAAAFPGEAAPVSFGNLVRAIAAFERTLISGDSPFDRYVFGGEHQALTPEAKRGMALFFSRRAGCAGCHSGFNLSGNWRDTQGATGRASFAANGTSTSPIRVPTLRNVALTAPYMHDGRFATLEEVLGHYSAIGARVAAAATPAAAAARE
jgi:hypothetical protein